MGVWRGGGRVRVRVRLQEGPVMVMGAKEMMEGEEEVKRVLVLVLGVVAIEVEKRMIPETAEADASPI